MSELEKELPAGDTFDRAYVEKLRAEAAGYRTKLKTFTEAFEGFNPEETEWMLDKVSTIAANPDAGAESLLDIVKGFMGEDELLAALEIEVVEDDGEEDPEEEDPDMSAAEELRKILAERDEADAKAAEEAELESAREEIYAEIEAAGFERGTDGFQYALAIGQAEVAAGRDPSFAALAPRIAAAAGIENFEAPVVEEPEGGKAHPSTAGAGGSGAATENEKDWIAEAKESGSSPWEAARARLEARLDTAGD